MRPVTEVLDSERETAAEVCEILERVVVGVRGREGPDVRMSLDRFVGDTGESLGTVGAGKVRRVEPAALRELVRDAGEGAEHEVPRDVREHRNCNSEVERLLEIDVEIGRNAQVSLAAPEPGGVEF